MFDSEQMIRFKRLDLWFETPLGSSVADAFCEALSSVSPKPRGEILLQLGTCGSNRWLDQLHYPRQWIIASYNSFSPRADCYGLFHKLPLDRNSVDCVVAPLTIHAFNHDHRVLDEIDRVLKPMGHVIFFGINALSLWGLWLKWSNHACFGRSHGYAHSLLALKHAMLIRDYTAINASVFHYMPPVRHANWQRKLALLNQIGNMVAPMPSAFYCLIMQKKVSDYLFNIKPVMSSALVSVS